MIAYLFSKFITMGYGTLYPAYCSYKAVKNRDVKEYVHWMMYWIVFSIFSVFEVFADTFIGCWFPFYYELKIIFMIWMLSPTTQGGSILYRRIIHPSLTKHEPEIDAYLTEFKLRTSSMIMQWGSKAFSYVTEMVMNTMLRAGAGDFRFMNKVTTAQSYENIDQPDMNRNNQFQRDLSPRDLSPDQSSDDPDYFPLSEQNKQVGMRQRSRYAADALQYGSVDDNLGGFMDTSGEDSQSQQPPKLRSSSRKKKESNVYGTMPRQTKTKKSTK